MKKGFLKSFAFFLGGAITLSYVLSSNPGVFLRESYFGRNFGIFLVLFLLSIMRSSHIEKIGNFFKAELLMSMFGAIGVGVIFTMMNPQYHDTFFVWGLFGLLSGGMLGLCINPHLGSEGVE